MIIGIWAILMEARKTRKLWSDESMRAAVESVNQGKGLREAGRLYNVPVETLRRRVTGKVDLDCRPGPATILTKEEEERIVHYLIQMADMGYGLTREAVMHMVYIIVEKCKRPHPFKNEKAGRWWFQGFKSWHPNLTNSHAPIIGLLSCFKCQQRKHQWLFW